MSQATQAHRKERRFLCASALLVFAAAFLVGMEWLFFVTKPSFMSAWPPLFKLEAPALLVMQLLLFGGGTLLVLAPVAMLLRLGGRWGDRAGWLLLLLPATALLTVSGLLLVDNFTNTLFGQGVAAADGRLRWFYLLGLSVLGLAILRSLGRFPDGVAWNRFRPWVLGLAGGILAGSLLLSGWALQRQATTAQALAMAIEREDGPLKRPNILLLATDGVSAKIHSYAGNPNHTTPTIDRLVPDSLTAARAFTNAERTTGAVTSLLTGKFPTTNHVLFPPHTLNGDAAVQHLPGLLQRLGYVNFQESVRYYADANDLNFVDGFDFVNGVEDTEQRNSRLLTRFDAVLHARIFARRVNDRVEERLRHLVLQQPMPDPFREVKGEDDPRVYAIKDRQRLDRAITFVENVERPFFMHLHLMGTHCCNFKPRDPRFSLGEFPTENALERARLQDLLLEADGLISELLATLESTGKLDDTLVIYHSDHPEYWEFEVSVPLLFRFPGKEHAGVIENNVQLLDVAPTILDYMNLEAPPWMEGASLLAGSPDPYRPIFGVTQLERERFVGETRDHLSRIVGAGPPRYGLEVMGMIVCDRWYQYALATDALVTGVVPGHRGGCEPARLPDDAQARRMIREHLQRRGFQGLGDGG